MVIITLLLHLQIQKDTFATIDAEQWSNVLVVVQDRLSVGYILKKELLMFQFMLIRVI